MKEKLKLIGLIAPAIFVVDQVTKWFIVRFVPLGSKITVWENFFDIVHTRNTGAAFGMLAQWNSAYRDFFFYVLTVTAFLFLFYFLRQIPPNNKGRVYPIALIMGGALGNITDRLFRGSVVDFLSFHWHHREVSWTFFDRPIQFELTWPAFNVADSAITVGVFWLMVIMTRKKSA